MKKVAIYTRVSTGSDEQASSLKSQQEYYENWCKQNEYELYNVYGEKGMTGTNARRPEFIQMMWDAGLDYQQNNNDDDSFVLTDRKPKFNLIVCKDVSRFSRNTDIGMKVIRHLRKKKVYVYFENTGLHTKDEDWELRASIMFTIAQNESHNTSRRIKFSKKHTAQQGIYKTAIEPYGYHKDEDGKLVIKKDEVEVVKYIYEQFETKGGYTIAKELNQKNIPTKKGGIWGSYHILRIIKNQLYTGTPVVNKTTKDNVTDTKSRKTEKHEQVDVINGVEPIVSHDTWVKMNEIRESRVNKSSKRGRKPATNDPYYFKLYCANCGSRMTRHSKVLGGGKYRYSYMCHNRTIGKPCKMRAVSQSILDEFMGRITLSNLSDAMGNHYNLKVLNQRIKQESNQLSKRVKALNEQIRELQTQSDTITDSLITSLVDSPQSVKNALSKRIDDNDKEIKQLQSQLEKTNLLSLKDIQDSVQKKSKLIEQLKTKKYIKLENKIELADEIIVNEFEIEFNFMLPNYVAEIEAFNELYPNDPIQSTMGRKSFSRTIRREHKQAREYWEQVEYDYQTGKNY